MKIELNSILEKTRIYFIVILFIAVVCLIFGWDTYHWKGIEDDDDVTLIDKFFNRLYFSFITFSTIGYGDITPKSKQMRLIIMTLSMFILVGVVHIIFK